MWRRLPTWFPNLRLQMLPLTPEQKAMLYEKGWLREVAFKCEPRVNKLELKAFLEAVHGMKVERVNTLNYQGKKKKEIDNNGKPHYYRLSDWKKAYVLFKPPSDVKQQWNKEQQEKRKQQLEELKHAALARSRLPDFLPAAAAAVARRAAPAVKSAAAAEIKARAAQRSSRGSNKAAAKQGPKQRQGSKSRGSRR